MASEKKKNFLQDVHSSGKEEVDNESHGIREDTPSFSPVALGASVLGEGVEGEDVEEMEEEEEEGEEGDDDVLDFEYEFDDDDDEGADYDLSWRKCKQKTLMIGVNSTLPPFCTCICKLA